MFGFFFTGILQQIVLQSAIVWVVAAIVTVWLLRPPEDTRTRLLYAAMIALGGTMAFNIPVWVLGFLPFFLNVIAGIVLFWLVVSGLLDRFYNLRYDESYANTGQIVVPSLLLWLIIYVGLPWLAEIL